MFVRRTVPVFLLAAALFAFIWFFERKAPTTEESRERAQRILDIDPEKAVRIESWARGEKLWSLARKKGRWELDSPVARPAEPEIVSGVVVDLCRVSIEGKLPEPVDRKAYGLDPAERVVKITSDAGTKTIRIGSAVPGFEAVAVEIEGEKGAWAAKRAVEAAASRAVADLRAHDVLRELVADAEEISVSRPAGGAWTLVRRKDGWWVKSEGLADDIADATKVEKLIGALSALRVLSFGGVPPAGNFLAIAVRSKSGAVETFRIEPPGGGSAGPPAGQLRLAFQGENSLATATIPEDVPPDPRSLAILGNRPVAPSAFTIRRGGESREFTSKSNGNEWMSAGKAVDSGAVIKSIDTLRSAAGDRLVPVEAAASLGLDAASPAWSLEMTDPAGERHLVDVLLNEKWVALRYRARPNLVVMTAERGKFVSGELAKLLALPSSAPSSTAPAPSSSGAPPSPVAAPRT